MGLNIAQYGPPVPLVAGASAAAGSIHGRTGAPVHDGLVTIVSDATHALSLWTDLAAGRFNINSESFILEFIGVGSGASTAVIDMFLVSQAHKRFIRPGPGTGKLNSGTAVAFTDGVYYAEVVNLLGAYDGIDFRVSALAAITDLRVFLRSRLV